MAEEHPSVMKVTDVVDGSAEGAAEVLLASHLMGRRAGVFHPPGNPRRPFRSPEPLELSEPAKFYHRLVDQDSSV